MIDSGSDLAIHNGFEIHAHTFDATEWYALQSTYKMGEIVMPCCNSPAVPKTSSNGLQFFAHHNGECTTAPETIWHSSTKQAVANALSTLGVNAELEVSSENKRRWQADVFFVHQGINFAIEIQRSYQHLDEYLQRQKRYEDDKVKAFWLLHPERYKTVTLAMAKLRIKTEFGGKQPKGGGVFPCLPSIPIACAEGEPIAIRGAGLFKSSMENWLAAIVDSRFYWENGKWLISDKLS